MILDRLCRRVAGIAAGSGPFAPGEIDELERILSELEASIGDLAWTKAGWLAFDLGEVHRRISALPDGLPSLPLGEAETALRDHVGALYALLRAKSDARSASERRRIRDGELRGPRLLRWLEEQPSADRDMAVEHLLGVAHRPLARPRLAPDLVDCIPSGIAHVVRAVEQIPIVAEDVFVDIGAGLGKVAMMVHLLSGAQARGIELQAELVELARARARELGLDGVTFENIDARRADFSGATVVYLYLPFTGETLSRVLERLEAASRQRKLVVCTLGLDLGSCAWLKARESDDVWLSIYDSR